MVARGVEIVAFCPSPQSVAWVTILLRNMVNRGITETVPSVPFLWGWMVTILPILVGRDGVEIAAFCPSSRAEMRIVVWEISPLCASFQFVVLGEIVKIR